MALTNEKILENKNTFINLISKISVPGAKIDELIKFLTDGGFFEAPASTIYHNSFEGGLCQHSLNVYYNLVNLYEMYKPYLPYQYDQNSLLICGLLHDISKVGFYEKTIRNQKYYHEKGSKTDNMGKFDWVSVQGYSVADKSKRFLAGTHEENSMLLVCRYIPLLEEEMIAILNHHCHTNDGNTFSDQSAVTNKYPLLTLLHSADFLSCFILERDNGEESF